ncbi:ATP-dependent Clp protease ATP-binding subunit [Streptococcus pyogenes]|nr:ATP-dependent Clp protease ATP-binding subunit [Streptococcus pyogenes]
MTHFSGKDPFVNMDDIFNQLMANMCGYRSENPPLSR